MRCPSHCRIGLLFAFVVVLLFADVLNASKVLFDPSNNLKYEMAKAIIQDDSAAVENLLSAGVDPNGVYLDTAQSKKLVYGNPWLHWAATFDAAESTKVLLKYNAGVGKTDSKGWTALHFAAYYGNVLDVAKLLLCHGAEVNVKHSYGTAPLTYTAVNGNVAMAKASISLLIGNGADVDSVERAKWTALHYTGKYGHVDVAKLEPRNNYGWTPLHRAAHDGHLGIVKVLIKEGADVNNKNDSDWTPLHYAARSGEVEICKVLLGAGASKTGRNRSNERAVDVVCESPGKCTAAVKAQLTQLLTP